MSILNTDMNFFEENQDRKVRDTISVIIPDVRNPFFAEIIFQVENYLRMAGYSIKLYLTKWKEELENEAFQDILLSDSKGLIFAPINEDSDFFDKIKIPMISLTQLDSFQCSYIEVDNIEAAYTATKYLIDCGYEKLAMIGGPEKSSTSSLRRYGFRKAILEEGLDFDEKLIMYTNFDAETGYECLKNLILRNNVPNGIVCANDNVALGVQKCAFDHNINIPEQLGIIGFDNIAQASYPQVQLTTMSQPLSDIGRMTVEILLKSIEVAPRSFVQRILLHSELIRRRSTK